MNTAKIIDFEGRNMEEMAKDFVEYKRIKKEAETALAELQKSMIALMDGQAETVAGIFKIANTVYTENRLDSAALKKELPEVAARYMKESERSRFSVTV